MPKADETSRRKTVDSMQKISYLKIRLVLGLTTLLIGIWATNLALFQWVERAGFHYLFGKYSQYVCAYGGISAIVFGSMLVNDYLVHMRVSKRKDKLVIIAQPENQPLPEIKKSERRQRIINKVHGDIRKTVVGISLTILLLVSCAIVAYSMVLYTSTIIITPINPWYLQAFIAYRSNSGTYGLSSPKIRGWDSVTASWSDEFEMSNAGSPVRFARIAVCPRSDRAYEKIVVTLSDDGYLEAYVCNGTGWIVTNNVGQVWTSAPTDARRPFDIAYESLSGEALLVYGTTVAGIRNNCWTNYMAKN